MPCILKKSTNKSPGIIVFTSAELTTGDIANSKILQGFLSQKYKENKWIFGCHVQGNVQSYLKKWPEYDWCKFVMSPDSQSSLFANIKSTKIIPLTAMNFSNRAFSVRHQKIYDICVISRASSIKRMEHTLKTLKKLFLLKPELRVIFSVPDPRNFFDKAKNEKLDIFYDFFRPQIYFNTSEMEKIDFISTSQESFGIHPLSFDTLSYIIGSSKFSFLSSHLEGGPRVFGESLLSNTPCIYSENLKMNLDFFDKKNSLSVSDNESLAAKSIYSALNEYDNFEIDIEKTNDRFSEQLNIPKLLNILIQILKDEGFETVEDDFYLEKLSSRVCSHYRKGNFQFLDFESNKFFDWFSKIENQKFEPYDEDTFFFNIHPKKESQNQISLLNKNIKTLVSRLINKIK